MIKIDEDENEIKEDLKRYNKVYYQYFDKRLSLLYDSPCMNIYKDLLHPEYKKEIIKQTIKIIKKINKSKDILTEKHFCVFKVNEMIVKISMNQDTQWSYWNSIKNYLEIQTFVFNGKTFCDIVSQDDFLQKLLYEVDFYYSRGIE